MLPGDQASEPSFWSLLPDSRARAHATASPSNAILGVFRLQLSIPCRYAATAALPPPRLHPTQHQQPASHLPVALTLFVPAASLASHGTGRPPMASIAGSSALSFARPAKAINTNSLAFSPVRKGNAFLRLQPIPMRSVSCAAKKDTVDKVCEIVKKQLALADETAVCGESKFSELGADSLDTVEIVMGLEEHFKITVEETSAQAIATVEDAANLIDDLVSKNA